MRIAYFLHTASATDGSSKALLHLVKEMALRGVTPLVILPCTGEICILLKDMHIEFYILRWRARPSTYPCYQTLTNKLLFIPRLIGRLLINTLATFQSIKIIRDFQPDIIHTNTSILAIGYYTASYLQIPHIWHIREYSALKFGLLYNYPSRSKQLSRYKCKDSYTIAITKKIQYLNSLTDWSNSIVIYDGVLPLNTTYYQPDKNNYFLFAGTLSEIKGILPLIDAYAEYCKKQNNPLPLHIAGYGSKEYTLLIKNKIIQYGIEENVVLLGIRKDILSLYQNAKALIVPSLLEGFGFITAEAMFCGCLVIGNDVAGTKEQFDNGKALTGKDIALRYNTQEQLVQHLIDVSNNPTEYYEPLVLRAQHTVSQLYSIEVHSHQVYDLYIHILDGLNKQY